MKFSVSVDTFENKYEHFLYVSKIEFFPSIEEKERKK